MDDFPAKYCADKNFPYGPWKIAMHQQKSTCVQLQWLFPAFTSLSDNLHKNKCSKLQNMSFSPISSKGKSRSMYGKLHPHQENAETAEVTVLV